MVSTEYESLKGDGSVAGSNSWFPLSIRVIRVIRGLWN